MSAQPLAPELRSSSAISLSVVICCYSAARRALLDSAVAAVLAQLGPADEFIVVVDGRVDSDAEGCGEGRAEGDTMYRALAAAYTGRVQLVRNRFRPGLSGARNTGLQLATREIMVFLDDDAELAPGGLDDVRAAFTDPTLTALGGAVHPSWPSGRPPVWFPPEFGWVVGCDYRGLPPDGATIRNPIGAAMAVRRAELAAVDGFSDRLGRVGSLPAGCEETMMGIQLTRRDPRARIVRRTRFAVAHTVSADRITVSYFARRCFHEGRSKAVLSRLCGRAAALESERTYATRTLPTGAWRARRHPTRVLALIVGLMVTAAGYLAGAMTYCAGATPYFAGAMTYCAGAMAHFRSGPGTP